MTASHSNAGLCYKSPSLIAGAVDWKCKKPLSCDHESRCGSPQQEKATFSLHVRSKGLLHEGLHNGHPQSPRPTDNACNTLIIVAEEMRKRDGRQPNTSSHHGPLHGQAAQSMTIRTICAAIHLAQDTSSWRIIGRHEVYHTRVPRSGMYDEKPLLLTWLQYSACALDGGRRHATWVI